MSCRNLRRWPELDHFVFKVLPCSAPGANEPDTIVRSRIRQCSLRLLAPAVWQIQSATDARLALCSRYLTHGDFPTVIQLWQIRRFEPAETHPFVSLSWP